jgi:hypothetical protein
VQCWHVSIQQHVFLVAPVNFLRALRTKCGVPTASATL